MSDTKQAVFQELQAHFRQTALLQSSADALEWDERTGLPNAAGEYRADQVTLLRGLVHKRRTDPQLANWLDSLADWPAAADPHGDIGATLKRLREDFERDRKLPQSLVEALSRATVRGQQVWDAARKADRYGDFQATLAEIVRLKREAATCLAEEGQTLYDALLDEYEPGAKAAELEQVFRQLKAELVPLVARIRASHRQPDVTLLQRDYPIDAQRKLSHRAAAVVGFDFNRGRLDETSHPFCTNLGPDDCRILSRYEQNWFPGGLFGTLHEAGHGMYDQGLRREWYGLPPGSFVSLGIHESQSRLWENLVGRSRAFWEFFYPQVQAAFPAALQHVAVDDFHFALNVVRPSLIRVEADEATYNLHIIIRFELERRLLSGELDVADLPAAWNAEYESAFGLCAPSDADGVLQDVHWSAGLIGYFPTYTLGNIYAAQFYAAAERDLGDLDAMFAAGAFQPLLGWLQEQVHRWGRNLNPTDLVSQATGQAPDSKPLIDSLTERYASLYELS
ncbi:carboxypeptidase M32 [Planctomycetaceae bacterium SH139]